MLSIQDIKKSFGEKVVLDGLNLEVQEGSIFGLVGVNGAGKSTLLRIIAGVYEADEGRVLLSGHDTFHEDYIRSSIAFVSDEQYYPLGCTIESLKLFYETLYSFSEAKYQKYLDIFELSPKMAVTNLSKGMKRRVALMFALSIEPKLILLDEAYDGLEPLARHKFKQALTEIIETEGVSVIISSHNLKELEDICDSFGILEGGKIVSYGDLLESKEMINKYQLAFDKEIDESIFEGFDVLRSDIEGRVCQLVIRGNEEEVKQMLEELHPVLLDVLQVNFEELFMYELESRGQ